MEWKLHPTYGYPQDNVALLLERAKNIDLARLGCDLTSKHPMVDDLKMYYNDDEDSQDKVKNNYDQLKKILLAIALTDNISMTEAGLVIRWLLPKYDFADGWGRPIKYNEWWVPANGDMFEPALVKNSLGEKTDCNEQIIYQTCASVARNDRKCAVLFGFGFGAGASRTITTVKVKHSDVYTRAIFSMDHIPEGRGALALEQPLFWKRNDDMVLWATYPASNWKGKRDNLVVYGFVCEALGVQTI